MNTAFFALLMVFQSFACKCRYLDPRTFETRKEWVEKEFEGSKAIVQIKVIEKPQSDKQNINEAKAIIIKTWTGTMKDTVLLAQNKNSDCYGEFSDTMIVVVYQLNKELLTKSAIPYLEISRCNSYPGNKEQVNRKDEYAFIRNTLNLVYQRKVGK